MTISRDSSSLPRPQTPEGEAVRSFIQSLVASMGEKRRAKFRTRMARRIADLESCVGADLGRNVFRIRDPKGVARERMNSETLAEADALRVLVAVAFLERETFQ